MLVDAYPIGDIVGHSEVTSRKVDPGPALRVAEVDSVLLILDFKF